MHLYFKMHTDEQSKHKYLCEQNSACTGEEDRNNIYNTQFLSRVYLAVNNAGIKAKV